MHLCVGSACAKLFYYEIKEGFVLLGCCNAEVEGLVLTGFRCMVCIFKNSVFVVYGVVYK